MKYKEHKNINYAKVGEEILSFWKENKVFEKSIEIRAGFPSFTFYEGPPSANGTPGIHHVMARAVKDIFCRYKTMKGFQVKRKGGWDTHGLPVELQVEKDLNITKEDIGKTISVEEYNQKCREAVMKYTDEWNDLTEKVGYWVDLDNPYITYDRKYMETLWYLLKEFYKKGLLYKGYTIQPYSPAAGTGLSSHELNQPGCYRMVKDTSVIAQFKIRKTNHPAVEELLQNENEEVFFLAWTTTPWTLPANNALAVGENITYVKVKTFNQYTYKPISVVLANEFVGKYFNAKAADLKLEDYKPGNKLIPFEIGETMMGEGLVGMEFEQLLPYVPLPYPAFTVIAGDFITTEEGTGIVHISKTFGADDYRVSVKNNIPGVMVKDDEGNDVPIVDKQGRFVKEITDFAGMYVKNYEGKDENDPEYRATDVLIAIKLKEENKAFKVEKYEHSYPHCWRTDMPVLYYPMDSWFIKTTANKHKLAELNKTINWKPASTGSGRFGNWLENLVDWNLSRSRYWGTPLPIWVTEDKKEEKCIGSLAELKNEVEQSIKAGFMSEPLPDDFDLHRPFVDKIYLVSPSGKKMIREEDLIDVWFDSGSMPYAQWHYPFENKEIFEQAYPADFIAEGVDQTRGWFFTLHVIAGMLFDSVAFKNVVSNGLVLDKNGNKMSKRLGNAIDPFKTIAQYGPDATRWYMIANANPWDNLKFDLDGIVEIQRRFFGTLQNTYSFFALYANIDGFKYEAAAVPLENRVESDRWIISRLNTLISKVDAVFDDYEPTRAVRAIQDFVIDDLSNWYVRLNRKRFWKPADSSSGKEQLMTDKLAAYQTLYECLITVTKLSSPVAPFYSEQIFQDLNQVTRKDKAVSVHLTDFPKADVSAVDVDLEEKMDLAQKIASLVHSLRKLHKMKVRQPLSKILVPTINEKIKIQVSEVAELIKSEVNIKNIEFIDETSGVLVKKIKPNFARLGRQYGPKMKDIAKAIQSMTQEDINGLEKSNYFKVAMPDGGVVELSLEDVEIAFEDIPGWLVASEGNITIALDITLTEELKKEGIARDLVNRIQNMRKDMGLDVQDKIKIIIKPEDELVRSALLFHKEYICSETQALNLVISENLPESNVIDIDAYRIAINIELEPVGIK